jgi:FixJ family two-component response regulator
VPSPSTAAVVACCLVVDDDAHVRRALARVIETLGLALPDPAGPLISA